MSCLRHPGESLTLEDIAAWCDCRKSAIARIEKVALAKMKQALEELSTEAGERNSHGLL